MDYICLVVKFFWMFFFWFWIDKKNLFLLQICFYYWIGWEHVKKKIGDIYGDFGKT